MRVPWSGHRVFCRVCRTAIPAPRTRLGNRILRTRSGFVQQAVFPGVASRFSGDVLAGDNVAPLSQIRNARVNGEAAASLPERTSENVVERVRVSVTEHIQEEVAVGRHALGSDFERSGSGFSCGSASTSASVGPSSPPNTTFGGRSSRRMG